MIKKIKDNLYRIKQILLMDLKLHNLLRNALTIAVGKNSNKLFFKNGVELYAPKNLPLNEMVSEIFIQNIYTPTNFEIGPSDIIIDIGANIGIFSLFAAKKTCNLVYAFEPFIENIKYLMKNMQVNGVKNVLINKLAVSNKISKKKLYLTKNPAGHILSYHNIKEEREYIEVPTTTLQSILDNNNLEQVDFLKIDCEGCEGAIFMSTPKEYLRKIKKIAMEFHDNVSPLKHYEIQGLLEEAGFVTKLNWNSETPIGFLYAYNLR